MSNQLTINGLQLPASYCALAAKYEDIEGFCNLKLKNPKDSFGYPLECELAQIYSNEQKLKEITDSLNKYFVPDGYYGELDNNHTDPESLKDITDFKKIVCFGIAGDGSQFCFDFRDCANAPTVIWWEDDHWRKISNSFEEFICLFSNS